MTLTELKYAVAVARELHFGRAAESCFVSQPTLSVAVRKLEEELGGALFERGPGEVTITAMGERVIGQAQRVLEESETIRRLASEGADDLSGPIRLGVIHTVAPYLLPKLVPLLHKAAPNMPLQIQEGYTADLDYALRAGELDALILSTPFGGNGVITKDLYKESFVVAMPKGHALEKKKTVTANQLAKEDLLLLGAGHCFRDQVMAACPQCIGASVTSQNITAMLEGSSLETMRMMVATGMGVTVLPQTSVNTHPADKLLSVRPFADPAPRRSIALAWRKSYPRPGAIEVLVDSVAAVDLGEGVVRL